MFQQAAFNLFHTFDGKCSGLQIIVLWSIMNQEFQKKKNNRNLMWNAIATIRDFHVNICQQGMSMQKRNETYTNDIKSPLFATRLKWIVHISHMFNAN